MASRMGGTALAGTLLAVLATGCGGGGGEPVKFDSGRATIEGTVTLGGMPARGAKIQIEATNGDAKKQAGIGRTGRYSILDVPFGEYKITITDRDGKAHTEALTVDRPEMSSTDYHL